MKKVISFVLVLVLCLSLTAVCFADNAEFQPTVVSAKLVDGDGKTVQELDPADIVLVPYQAKDNEDTDKEAAEELTDAVEAVDGTPVLGDLCADVESKYVVEKSYAEQWFFTISVPNGGTGNWVEKIESDVNLFLEIVVDMGIGTATPVVLYNDKVFDWSIIDGEAVNVDGNQLSFRIPNLSPVLCLGAGSDEPVLYTKDEAARINAEAASKQTPSVAAKSGPVLTDAMIYSKVDRDAAGAAEESDLDIKEVEVDITSYADRENAPSKDVTDALNEAYEDICGVTDLGELCPALNDAAKAINPDFTSANFVARDLFEISAANLDATEGLSLTFEPVLASDDELAVIVKVGDAWKLIDAKNVIKNDDGTVTINFDEVGVVAFLAAVAGDTAVASSAEEISDTNGAWAWVAAGGIAAAGAGTGFAFSRKKRK